jgi:CopG antitoxin of type II toxin-antitoxin system
MEEKDLQEIPHFNSEDEEATFWLEHDVTDYYDASRWVETEFSKLRPSDAVLIPPGNEGKGFEDKLDVLLEKHRVTLEGLAER